ncbi:hypothetical protein SBADM41S_00013 [Streptomyces badius]
MPADLELPIGPALEVKRARRVQVAEVSGAVGPHAAFRQLDGGEHGGGQLRFAEISEGESLARHVDLSRTARRAMASVRAEHDHPGAGNGLSERNAVRLLAVLGADRSGRGVHAALGRPVAVDQGDAGVPSQERRGVRGRHALASHVDLPQPGEALRILVHEQVEQRGGQPQCGGSLFGDHAPQRLGQQVVPVRQFRGAAGHQLTEEFVGVHVPPRRRRLRHHVAPAEADGTAVAEDARDRPVRQYDALGQARAAGGEDHHGRVLGRGLVQGRSARPVRRDPVQVTGRRPYGGGRSERRRTVGDHHRRVAEHAQHLPQPGNGPTGVQASVGGAQSEHGQLQGDQLRRARQQHRHDAARDHTVLGQPGRVATGRRVQRGVVDAGAPVDQGRRPGGSPRVPGHGLVDQGGVERRLSHGRPPAHRRAGRPDRPGCRAPVHRPARPSVRWPSPGGRTR